MRALIAVFLFVVNACWADVVEAEPQCSPAVIGWVDEEAIRLEDGRIFSPADPQDARDLAPGDIIFACDSEIHELEALYPIPGRWLQS